MNLNQANLRTFFYAINAAFNKGLAQVWADFEKFCMVLNSTTAMEKYPMLLMTGSMR